MTDTVETVETPVVEAEKPVVKKPRKARVKKVKDAVVAAAPKVEDALNDVTETMKTELEEVIAEELPQAAEGTPLNKALRNAAIVCGIVLAAAVAWNVLF